MSAILPLMHCWTISAPSLPEELLPAAQARGFSLPGADDLTAFADLLGAAQEETPDQESSAQGSQSESSAPFALPALAPDALCGPFSLSCSVDFGALRGDHAVLTIDHICGRGSILLGSDEVARFDTSSASWRTVSEAAELTAAPCMLAVDLSPALLRGRKELLTIRFDESRPAGLCQPVMLRVSADAFLSRTAIRPDILRRTMTLCAQVNALTAGRYVLRAQPVDSTGKGGPIRESACFCGENASCEIEISMAIPGSRFASGKPYAAQSMKITLVRRDDGSACDAVCDSVTLMSGYSTSAPVFALPLTPGECMLPPDMLMEKLKDLNIPSVRMPIPAPDALYRTFTRHGVAALMGDNIPLRARLERHPCAAFAAERIGEYQSVSAAASAWQMDSMVYLPRSVDPLMTDADLLHEVSGRILDPEDAHVQSTLMWLRAVCVRIRAEAARQGRFSGALCAPGEWNQPDIADALRTAFAPVHLGVLPLCGAWWTLSRFSAGVHAFLPEGRYQSYDPLIAHVTLEDDAGKCLAKLRAPCRSTGGYIGLIEAVLPDYACVLTLHARLTLHDEVLEHTTLPVYVGERGALEAAFC